MSLLSELVGEGGVAVRPVSHPPLRSEVEQKSVIIDEEELFSSDDDLCEEERQRDQRGQDRLWAAEGKTNVTKIEVVTQALIDAAPLALGANKPVRSSLLMARECDCVAVVCICSRPSS